MTKDQIEALILQNLADQFTQLVAIYTAIQASNVVNETAARNAYDKLTQLGGILSQGLDNLRRQEKSAAEFAAD